MFDKVSERESLFSKYLFVFDPLEGGKKLFPDLIIIIIKKNPADAPSDVLRRRLFRARRFGLRLQEAEEGEDGVFFPLLFFFFFIILQEDPPERLCRRPGASPRQARAVLLAARKLPEVEARRRRHARRGRERRVRDDVLHAAGVPAGRVRARARGRRRAVGGFSLFSFFFFSKRFFCFSFCFSFFFLLFAFEVLRHRLEPPGLRRVHAARARADDEARPRGAVGSRRRRL